jgi:hypothetical protein
MNGYKLRITTLKDREHTGTDVAMVHAVFTLVEKFVEEELNGIETRIREVNSWIADELELELPNQGEILALNQYIEDLYALNSLYMWWGLRKLIPVEEANTEGQRAMDDEKMYNLMDIRPSLWV